MAFEWLKVATLSEPDKDKTTTSTAWPPGIETGKRHGAIIKSGTPTTKQVKEG